MHNSVPNDSRKCLTDLTVEEFAEFLRQYVGTAGNCEDVLAVFDHLEADEPLLDDIAHRRALLSSNTSYWDPVHLLNAVSKHFKLNNYLEIGVRRGRSLAQVVRYNPQVNVEAFDLWMANYAGFDNPGPKFVASEMSKFGHAGSLTFHNGNSHVEIPKYFSDPCCTREFDIIYVDGDHSYNGGLTDLRDVVEHVKAGGLIVFDDMYHPQHLDLFQTWELFKFENPNITFWHNNQGYGVGVGFKRCRKEEMKKSVSAGRLKIATGDDHAGMAVAADGDFGSAIRQLFERIKPHKIIETGTYMGTGTTAAIAGSLRDLGIEADFYTIEVNPQYHARAVQNIQAAGHKVVPVNGLSVPRQLLPTPEQIERELSEMEDQDIFVDHDPAKRIALYHAETNFKGVDNLMGLCLKKFDNKPDFILLDSAGHMGNLEFNYCLSQLRGPCYVALDDIYHVKHNKSFRQIQADPRFELVVASPEKYGFCIAKFTPDIPASALAAKASPPASSYQRILIVRPDSIGDFLIFSGVMEHFRTLYPNASISMLVQNMVAPLAEVCPHVDEVIAFDRKKVEANPAERDALLSKLQSRAFDLALYPLYSRENFWDQFTLGVRARRTVTIDGGFSNQGRMTQKANDLFYSELVPADPKPMLETARNDELIRNLSGGAIEPHSGPVIWLTEANRQTAASIVQGFGLGDYVAICPFAQARARQWPTHKWAELLEQYPDHHFVICGSAGDYSQAEELMALTRHRHLYNACGRTSIGDMAALIQSATLCISMESAPAHLAAAVGCPHVVIVGGGHFGRFMPYSPLTHIVANQMSCFNCDWKCQRRWFWTSDCVTAVETGKVKQAVDRFLVKRPPAAVPAEAKQACWCGGQLSPSVHPEYGLCANCGTLVLLNTPSKEEIEEFYGVDNYWRTYMDKVSNFPPIQWRAVNDFKDRIPVWHQILMQHKSSARRLLEIGCAHGGFLRYCRDKGIGEVVGVEVDEKTCGFARDFFGLKHVYPGGWPEAFLPFENFDAITGFDVIEHLADPVKGLQRIAQSLAPDGIFFLQIPVYTGQGPDYKHFRPGEHLWLFNEQSLQQIFLHTGLHIETIMPGCFEGDCFVIGRRRTAEISKCAPANHVPLKPEFNLEPTEAPSEPGEAEHYPHLVSAIISTYNSADTIRGCIEDLQRQSIADKLEIIVINSNSPGDEDAIVRDLMRKYDNIKYVRTPKRETLYNAWNRAIKMASGKYITNANCDDRHAPNCLEVLVRALEEHPNCAVAFADQKFVECIGGKEIEKPENGSTSYHRLMGNWCSVPSQPLWKKSIHDDLGYFDPQFFICGDYEFWCRVSQRYNFYYVRQTLGERVFNDQCLSKVEFAKKDGLCLIEDRMIRLAYRHAFENSMVIDRRGISGHPLYRQWPEAKLWRRRVRARIGGKPFSPAENTTVVHDTSRGPVSLSFVLTRRHPDDLDECLTSLTQQSCGDFEVIVVDRCGGGKALPQAFNSLAVRHATLIEDWGEPAAKNAGIALSSGQFAAFVDEDCVLDSHFVEHALAYLKTQSIHGLRCRLLAPATWRGYSPPHYDLGEKPVISTCEESPCVFRRETLVQLDGFDLSCAGAEITELCYRIFKGSGRNLQSIHYCPDVVVYKDYCRDKNLFSRKQFEAYVGGKYMNVKAGEAQNYLDIFRSFYPANQEAIRSDFTKCLNLAAALRDFDVNTALKWALQANALRPGDISCRYLLGCLCFAVKEWARAAALFESIYEPLQKMVIAGHHCLNPHASIFQTGQCFLSTCTKLAQCYAGMQAFGKAKAVYSTLLANRQVSLSDQLRCDLTDIVMKLDHVAAEPVFQQRDIASNKQKQPRTFELSRTVPSSEFLVTAIVSTYNSEQFIRGCLQDLVEQTLYAKGQLEIIVVNSGSEENEEAIVREFQGRYPNIQYIRTPRETIYAAWNHGVRAARGKYLTNANTDDRHAPEMLEKLARTLEENADISYVYSPFYITDVPNQTWQSKTPRCVSDWQREYSRPSLLQRYYCGPQPMWRRSLHDEYGYFDERMQVAGDYEFALRISQTHRLKLVNEPLGLYYQSQKGLERSAGTHESERIFTILLYRQFASTLIRRPLRHPAAEFAVILRNRNQGNIAASIESMRRQTLKNWELVIVNETSGGDSAEAIKGYLDDPRIKLVQGRSTLDGLAQISAEVFGELDGGQVLVPNALERMTQAHRQHAECGLIFSQHTGGAGAFRTYKLGAYLKAGLHGLDLNTAEDNTIFRAMETVTKVLCVDGPLFQVQTSAGAHPKETQPLVSVIIATHNRPESLKYAVASVLNQTYPNVEIIVVNDAGEPVDDLLAGLNMRGNIVSLRHEQNKGPAATRNTGLRAARGKYIAYLDDDDIFFPNHIEVLVTGLESSAYRFAYTHAHRSHQVQQNGRYVEIGRSQPYGCSVTHDQLLVRNLIPTLCIMHERACIEEVGYFDETFRTHEDWDMWIRMSQKFEFLHIPELTAQITWRDDGTTTTSRMQEAFLAAPERMYLKHRDAAAGKPAVLALQAERLRILKGQASKQASSAAPVLAYPTAATVQTASVETPAADIKPIGNAPARKYRIAVKFCTPSQKLRNWGDTWFARGLQRAFIQAGHDCVMHSREEWDQPDEDIDVAIHLKGLNAYNPKPHCFNVIWIISHPELHTADELNRFDAVFCGSKKYLEYIKPQLKVPCWYLPQAADRTVFAPIEKAAEQDIDLLFVGSNYYQNKNRRIIADVLATGRDYNLWVIGPYWKGYIDDKYVKDEYVLPEKLAELYARTKIVLNDHHDTMKQWGFVNDRTYSLAASNVFQISDAVEGLDELGVVTYQTSEDLREKIDFYLANESERMQAAAAVHERCRAFSFSQAAERMLQGIGSQWAARAGRREQAIAITTPAEAATASQPKVSVIMSCHNGEKYLAETIDSLLAQTLQEWELLAIDDGSTDGTLSILKFYAQKDGRIRLWRFEEKKGPYIRRNFAIRQSRAEFISIQDADDLMHPEKLGALYECIRSNPRLAIVGSHHRRFRETFRGEDFGDPIQRSCEHAEIMQGFKKSWQLCWHGSAIIRKSLFDTIGLYDEQPYGSDTFWLAKAGLYSLLTRAIEFRNVPKFLTYKREHRQSQTGTISPADPRNRRHYLEKYYINKLTEIAQNAVNNPNLDAAATLKACTCTDFIPVFGHMFEKWESEPVTGEMCRKMLERAAAQFAAEFYVSCLITLDRLEQMTGSQSRTWRNMNIITGLAAYASGDDELAAACLRKASRMNVSAADLLRRIESGAIPREARQRRQDVKAVIASSQGMISIEVPSGLSELTTVRSVRPISAGLPAGAERQDRQREACGYKV